MACRLVSAQSLVGTTSPRGQGTVALLAASRGLRSCLSRVGSYHLGYDQGMGNRGEVFMTWEGFEPGTWSLELWDLK